MRDLDQDWTPAAEGLRLLASVIMTSVSSRSTARPSLTQRVMGGILSDNPILTSQTPSGRQPKHPRLILSRRWAPASPNDCALELASAPPTPTPPSP